MATKGKAPPKATGEPWRQRVATEPYFQEGFQPRPDSPAAEFPIRRVLWATDGSDASQSAYEWTRWLCQHFDAEPIALTVAPPHPFLAATGNAPGGLIEGEEQAGQHIAQEAARRFGPTARALFRVGSPARVIGQIARDEKVDLVVVGSHGRSGMASAALGSVADGVRNTCPTSVLIARGPPPPAGVLVGHDGSTTARRAVTAGVTLAHALGVPARLVRVVPPPQFVPPERFQNEHARRAATIAVPKWEGEDLEAELRFGSPSQVILQRARETKAGLITIGSRGLGSVASFLLGSVSRRVSHDADASVLIVKDPVTATKSRP